MTIPFWDRYSTEARVIPASVLVLPPALSVIGLYPPARDLSSISLVASAAVVGIVILSNVVRFRGRTEEVRLFRKWGGPPTTRALRFRLAEDRVRVAQLHETVSSATGMELPGEEDERRDSVRADKAYEAAVRMLRELTRDPDRFRIVLAENAGYGMRRNLWATRDWGRTVTALGVWGAIAVVLLSPGDVGVGATAAVVSLNLLAFAFWQWLVSERWVQEAAETYAEALFRAAVALPPRTP